MTNRRGLLGLGIAVLLAGFASAQTVTDKKVSICHHSPGDPGHTQTIAVSASAVASHLNHGDTFGQCPSGCQVDSSLCDDGNQCTSDVCLPSGLCEHTAVDCNDGNPCTIDLCNGATGCSTLPNDGATCDDGSACTSSDVCSHGHCAGTSIPGCCATDAECDDGSACTDDSCSPATGCVHVPTTNPPQSHESFCSDGADNDCDGLVDSNDSDCVECAPGFGDCDGSPENGCETNLNGDTANCGACGNLCVAPNSSAACTGGTCEFICNAGFADCDGSNANGCESSLNAADNCGACGNVCVAPNSSAACTGGTCEFICNAGFADCDGSNANGCESSLNTVDNCGACGNVCPNSSCIGGACQNEPPVVNAGSDQSITLPDSASLAGTVTDDGLPAGSTLTISWSKVSGPGTVTFSNANASSTTASFSESGAYTLRLTANDEASSSNDEVLITVLPQN